jgi:hypothetical protein
LLTAQLSWKVFMMWHELQKVLVLVSSTLTTERAIIAGKARIMAHRSFRLAHTRFRMPLTQDPPIIPR